MSIVNEEEGQGNETTSSIRLQQCCARLTLHFLRKRMYSERERLHHGDSYARPTFTFHLESY